MAGGLIESAALTCHNSRHHIGRVAGGEQQMSTDWLATLQWMIPSPPVMATYAGNKRFVPIRQPLTPVSPVQWVAAADGFEHIILDDGQGSVGDAKPLGTVTAVDSDGIIGGISFSTDGNTLFYGTAGERLVLSGTIPTFTGGDFVLTGTHTGYLDTTTSSVSGGGFDAVTASSDHFRDSANVEFGGALGTGPLGLLLPPGGVFLTTAVGPRHERTLFADQHSDPVSNVRCGPA